LKLTYEQLQFQKFSREVIPRTPVVRGMGRGEERRGTEEGKDRGQKGKGRGGMGNLAPYPSRKVGACGGEGWGEAREGRREKGEGQGRGRREGRVQDPQESGRSPPLRIVQARQETLIRNSGQEIDW
jgi:hypothetical protein